MTKAPHVIEPHALSQDFMCAMEDIVKINLLENSGKATGADRARRIALKQMCVQILMKLHDLRRPQDREKLDNFIEEGPI